jgi:hypothetical protein
MTRATLITTKIVFTVTVPLAIAALGFLGGYETTAAIFMFAAGYGAANIGK